MNPFKKIRNWEQWPFKLLYAPLIPVWLWYVIKSRAVWFFTPSNPKLTFGGLDGEPKKEMHDLIPAEFLPVYFNVLPNEEFISIQEKIKQHGISYPLIVKPEIGGQGILFRKIDNEDQLRTYHQLMPVEYFIQAYVKYAVEVSIFYYRYPNEKKGVITGFLQKIPMQVTGNGRNTLRELILQNTKTKKRLTEILPKHANHLDRILGDGEKYMLSYAGNHNRGAQFIDLSMQIDEKLLEIPDRISNKINDFFYGRYDILCNSVEELRQGKNFYILEYNGAGAEPNHFYDTGYSLLEAYREILRHWKALYKISKYNHKQGVPYWPLIKGIRFRMKTKKYFKTIKKADEQIP